MLEHLKKLYTRDELLSGYCGIEREMLRVDAGGRLSQKPHPRAFGNKLHNPYITTDFAESQVEVVTPPSASTEETYHFTNALYDIVAMEAQDQLLWPQSMPNIIDEKDIIIAEFDDSEDGLTARAYREELILKYGGKKQLISGIHYNFSFTHDFMEKLYRENGGTLSFKDFKDHIYLKIMRNYLRYRWLIIYLLGASPILHTSYKSECELELREITKEVYTNDGVISFRNGHCGYRNRVDLLPDYSSIKAYLKSVNAFIQQGEIRDHKELYNPIRLKPKDKKNFESSLLQDGIHYLEYRGIDINPFEKGGISLVDLKFMQLFNLFLLIHGESAYPRWQEEAVGNHYKIAEEGQKEVLLTRDGQEISKTQWAMEIFDRLFHINEQLELGMEEVLEQVIQRIQDYKKTYSYRITQKIVEEGYLQGHLNLAREYRNHTYENRYGLEGFEDLELSTQILMKEAIKRGMEVKVLDRSENFISLEKNGQLEYVKQATKTSKDNYVSVLIMENKTMTKKVLAARGIRVPQGIEVSSLEELEKVIHQWIHQPMVIKPKSTNFGLGINIFKDGGTRDDILKAWELASQYDHTVLMEEFIPGKEYRFLIMDDQVVAILHRVPANVIGDGKSTIEELVEIKNQDPLRGEHYVKPLEKIKLDENALLFLKQQGLDAAYIPRENEVVYLRENSNISTGGDSIDYTESIPERFKAIAVQAAKAVGANFCGVDMMLEDDQDETSHYGIIELNFNPAVHIHAYPYKGKERNIGLAILKTLGLETN